MALLTSLLDIPWQRLNHRKDGFETACNHVFKMVGSLDTPINIIETGTSRILDNWEGDGQSTQVWDRMAEGNGRIRVFSIDLNEDAIRVAASQTKHVELLAGESVQVLSDIAKFKPEIPKNTWLLYLDSFDWAPDLNIDSSLHHIHELTTIFPLLPSGCMIMVDDCHGPLAGKHWMVEIFMNKIKAPRVHFGYQHAWIKP